MLRVRLLNDRVNPGRAKRGVAETIKPGCLQHQSLGSSFDWNLPDFVRTQSLRVVDQSINPLARVITTAFRQFDRASVRKMGLADLSGLIAAGREIDPLSVARPARNRIVRSRIVGKR